MKRIALMALLTACVWVVAASAGPVNVLTFEGLKDGEQILNFYNGGTGNMGSSGPNYGIAFGAASLALIDSDAGGSGNFANEPSADTIAFWLESGGSVIMDVAGGFTTGFSFFYSSSVAGSVTVYDGLGGTGAVLGTLPLGINAQDGGCTGDPTGYYCNWDPVGVAFSGIAKSVSFAGGANYTGFDDITLGSDKPGVPEPSTYALMGAGLAAVAWLRARKRA